MTIGVLALQGSFEAHFKALQKEGVSPKLIRNPDQLKDLAGLVIPGGESTTMIRLMEKDDFFPALQEFYQKDKPIMGTCAGLILMAKSVSSPQQRSLGFLDIGVERNGYGRQKDSFETYLEIPTLGEERFHAIFIRAPRIKEWGEKVQVLAWHQNEPVFVQQKNCLGATFHPELTQDNRIHNYFVNLCRGVYTLG